MNKMSTQLCALLYTDDVIWDYKFYWMNCSPLPKYEIGVKICSVPTRTMKIFNLPFDFISIASQDRWLDSAVSGGIWGDGGGKVPYVGGQIPARTYVVRSKNAKNREIFWKKKERTTIYCINKGVFFCHIHVNWTKDT